MANSDLVTKQYLDTKLEEFKKDLIGSVDSRMEIRISKAEDNIVERIIGEIRSEREEDEVHKFSHQRVNDDLHELQDKVAKLEKTS